MNSRKIDDTNPMHEHEVVDMGDWLGDDDAFDPIDDKNGNPQDKVVEDDAWVEKNEEWEKTLWGEYEDNMLEPSDVRVIDSDGQRWHPEEYIAGHPEQFEDENIPD